VSTASPFWGEADLKGRVRGLNSFIPPSPPPSPARGEGINRKLRHHPVAMLALALLFVVAGGGIYWLRNPTIFLIMGGKSRRVVVRDLKTVGDMLRKEQIPLYKEDIVAPPQVTPLQRGMAIKVTRVTHRSEDVVKHVPLRIASALRTRQNLRRVLVERGSSADRVETIDHRLYDGAEVSQKVVRVKIKKHPMYTLTLFNAKGQPIKTYDLAKARTYTMLATAYYVGDPMVPSDTTFGGHKLQRGLVAVDPRVIPLKTRLYIPGYGYAYADDTGSAIKGLRVDLAVKDKYEEVKYNHRKVTVYLLDKSNSW